MDTAICIKTSAAAAAVGAEAEAGGRRRRTAQAGAHRRSRRLSITMVAVQLGTIIRPTAVLMAGKSSRVQEEGTTIIQAEAIRLT
jgi:hypothetical protein